MALISKTVGSGGDYADWSAFRTAIAAASPLADDWEVTQISDVSDGGMVFTVIDLNGHNLAIKNASPPAGDPTAGYKYTCTGAFSFNLAGSNGGTFEVRDLNIDKTLGGGANATIYATNGTLGLFHDCFIRGNPTDNTQCLATGAYADAGATVYVWNMVCANGDEACVKLLNSGDANTVIVENCVAAASYGVGFKCNSVAVTLRNCVAFNNDGDDFAGLNGATGVNNASEDTTATTGWLSQSNGQPGIVPATEFESTTQIDADSMKVTDAGVCHDGGAAPTISGNTVGNRGDQRPQSNADVSIGADEFPSSPVPSSSSSPSPIVPVVIVATVPGKMPNMGRTLLLNEDGSTQQSTTIAAEYVPPYYRAVSMNSRLLTVRRALFGSNPDRDGLDYAVWQYMKVLHSTEYEDWITALDSRITYLGRRSLLDVSYGASVSRDGTAFQFVGTPESGGADGRLRETWNIEQIAAGVYRIMNMITRRAETYSVSLHDGFTDFMVMTGHAEYKVRIQTHLLAETSWTVEYLAAPGPAMDPVNRAAQAANIGIEAYNELFPARDPYKLFKRLWELHSLFPYKMSGYLLALIYRTEEIRSGAG